MSRNESFLDRVLRAVAGVVLAGVAVVVGAGSVLGIVLLVLAVVLLVTAAVGFCPLNRLVGVGTAGSGRGSGVRPGR
jgi:Protein of unknown function (DUF2892)